MSLQQRRRSGAFCRHWIDAIVLSGRRLRALGRGWLHMQRRLRMGAEPRNRPVPLHRRWVNDIVHFGKKSHSIGCNWRINVAPALAARAARQPAIGWAAMWMKALAIVGRRRAELRTAYLPFPHAHLYVHPECVCTITVERTWQGFPAVFFEQIARPDAMSLAELDAALRRLKLAPVEAIRNFRRLIRLARWPVLMRRLILSVLFYWSGPLRAIYMGTFAINPFPTTGIVTQSVTPLSFFLYFGLVEPDGDTQVQVLFDHRVMDGVEAYRLLRDVEATLNRDIAAELTNAADGAKPD
jgi:hypothetical protein